MSLEFEQLTAAVAEMAREVSSRRSEQALELRKALDLLDEYAESWDVIDARLDMAILRADEKHYRSARPLHHDLPLNQGITAEAPPEQATIIGTDGSQIVPDRHAPFLYYLINVGVISYFHGSGHAPEVASFPNLKYPRSLDAEVDDAFSISSSLVSMRRDLAEITTLLVKVIEARNRQGPTLGILDQRLLYWPIGDLPGRQGEQVVAEWQDAMSRIRQQGGWLVGYIDRPGKQSVLNLLHTLDLENSGLQVSDLYRGSAELFAGLNDTDIFDKVLEPGERSVVFVDISHHNSRFAGRDSENEVCFFYLKTGAGEGQLARVDIPTSVARDKRALGDVHALLIDQCHILGDYPYVITRADEIAVVGRRDQEELENRIALQLAAQDIHTKPTGKQQAKGYARANKTRYEG